MNMFLCKKRASRSEVKGGIPFLLFVAVLSLYVGLSFTMADFYDMPFSNARDFMVIAAQFAVIEVAVLLFVWLVSCDKYVFSVVFPLFSLLCSLAAYFRFTAKVSLTPMAIDLALVNDARTTMDVVTWQLVAFVVFSVAVGVAAVWLRFRRVTVRCRWGQMAVAAVCFVAYVHIPRFAPPIKYRIPFVVYYATVDYLDNRHIASENRPAFGGRAVCGDDSIDVVFVLGETLCARNMQSNGYHRATTPWLVRERNAVSMPNIYSEYGFTHTSVPYLLTRACPGKLDRAYSERSFISLFRKAGYHATWIANQESVETFAYFMHEADTLVYVNSGKSVYVFDQWLYGDILPALDRQLRLQANYARRLFVIHTIGSHWWYKAHYPRAFARWRPELKSRVMSANTKDEFVNSYDNTVLYSDYFWQCLRDRFRGRNAIVVYLSDHSENLGENGVFGHGEDSKPLHYPGCWIWMSDKYRESHPDKWRSLEANRTRGYNSAFLFHSLLDAGCISTPYIDRRYDIFR